MAKKFIPNTAASGAGTPFDNIVGLQTVQGGGLTQGNFEFTQGISEKSNRNFNIGVFQSPVSLEDLNLDSVNASRELIAKEYRVYPNYDLSQVTNFTIFGSLQKRFEVSVQRILNFFPAAIEVDALYYDFTSGETAYNITYDSVANETELTINVTRIKNPFSIDYSVNSKINLQNREQEFSPLRDLTNRYRDYSFVVDERPYQIIDFTSSSSLYSGIIKVIIIGNPFSGDGSTYKSLVIRPNDYYVEKAFSEEAPKHGLHVEKPKQQEYSNSTELSTYLEDENFEEDEEPIPEQGFHIPQDSISDSEESVKDEGQEDFTKLFKLIARLTHPDTCGITDTPEQKKNKLDTFMKARKAVESKNWYEICQIALDLGIELPEPTKKHLKFLEDEVIRVKNRISHISSTYAWSWYTDEQKRDFYMRSYINVVKG
jgi:hypothetical protein